MKVSFNFAVIIVYTIVHIEAFKKCSHGSQLEILLICIGNIGSSAWDFDK